MMSGVKKSVLLGRGVYWGRGELELELVEEVVVVAVVLEAEDVVMGLAFEVGSGVVVL